MTAELANAYGEWLGAAAPWSHFVTLTHDPKRLGDLQADAGRPYTRVGMNRHRRMVKDFVFDVVRSLDHSAFWWSEAELHVSGQPHEHALLAAASTAPVFSMMDEWFRRAGGWRCEPVKSVRDVTIYVAKYTLKAATQEPVLAGFAVHRNASHSLSFGKVIR